MKSTIGKKIMFLIFIPFLVIFGALAMYISGTLLRYVTNWAELEIKGISEINAADLEGRMDSVRISVLTTAEILRNIDPEQPDARIQAEDDIKSMFKNESIYNAWLAYEPQAFDGRDKEFTSDYPGAPSGRFVRSYIMEDGQIVVAPDMDEETLDDPVESPWYTVPRDTEKLYIDVDNEIPNLYDYGVGEEAVYTLSIVAPIWRGRRVIGCVGADVLFDNMTFGIDKSREATVAVFYPNGRIFYSPGTEYAEETIETLGFSDAPEIRRVMAAGESLFLPNEYCIFTNRRSFTYFHPIYTKETEGGSLYLYVALPRAEALEALIPVYALIAATTVTVLIVLLTLFVYVINSISKPINKLILAADAISQGNFETEIMYFSESANEISVLSRSLHRMVEQFRVYIMSLEQSRSEISVHSQLAGFMDDGSDIGTASGELAAMLCRNFRLYKATIVYCGEGKPAVLSCMGRECELEKRNQILMFHSQTLNLLSGKKIVFLNKCAISAQGVGFVSHETVSVCLLPLRKDGLIGYIILENDNMKNTFNAGTESILLYIAKIFGEWMPSAGVDVNPDEEPPAQSGQELSGAPAEEHEKLSLFDGVSGLEARKAVKAMGGLYDAYEKAVALTFRLMPETIEKLDKYVNESDINPFAIEIHGIKGVLNNIGAEELGREAAHLEKAALKEDAGLCRESYPGFRENVRRFLEEMRPIIESLTAGEKEKGDALALAAELEKAKAALEGYDSVLALDIIYPLLNLCFDERTDALLKDAANALETFDCEAALEVIGELAESVGDKRNEDGI